MAIQVKKLSRQFKKYISTREFTLTAIGILVLAIPMTVLLALHITQLYNHAAGLTPASPPFPPGTSFGQAIENSSFSVPGSNLTVATTTQTIEAWVKPNATIPNTVAYTIIAKASSNGTVPFALQLTPQFRASFIFSSPGGSGWIDNSLLSSSILPLNMWSHIAVVLSPGANGTTAVSLYLNGSLEAINQVFTGSLLGGNDSGTIQIGNDQQGDRFSGDIDEVRISSNARYTAQFTPQRSPFITDTNTIVLYHLDGNLLDASSHDLNGSNGTAAAVIYVPSTADIVPNQLVGDINGDNVVDLTDLSLLGVNWQRSGKAINPTSTDINGDGIVDLTDFSLLAGHWGQ